MEHLTLAHLLRRPVFLLAFGFGTGLAPKAPGTFGTFVGVVLFIPAQHLPLTWYLTGVGLLFVLGIWLCDKTARELGVHDHPGIVWDEIVGFLITMAAAPSGGLWIVVGFILFRLFDILKPWPIGYIDRRLTGGIGIMLDDALAGLYGLITLQGLYRLLTAP